MSELFLSITPHDPIIARDARPFGFGLRMKSLDWPYPSVLAGSVRTMLGKMNGSRFDGETVKKLKNVSVSGPLPFYNGDIYLPAPADILVEEKKDGSRITHAVRPMAMRKGEGCNLPYKDLLPSMLPENVSDGFKPAKIAPFWSMEKVMAWLKDDGMPFDAPPSPDNVKKAQGFLDYPKKESRTHVKIKRESGTAEDEMLFETVGLDFGAKGIQIAARVDTGDFLWKNSFHPLGGERRLAYWKAGKDPGWSCPREIMDAFREKHHLRMVLATPAVFSGGWLPGWIDKGTFKGRPPGAPDSITLRLVSACVNRWKPLSGWSLETGRPKPIRRLVPAGSVYFFEVTKGNPADLVEPLWLRPVSDAMGGQDYGRDGFGLALWGVWDAGNESRTDE